jgi:acyl-coenzyme A synthetase/AMP-(fatty) acid ligase
LYAARSVRGYTDGNTKHLIDGFMHTATRARRRPRFALVDGRDDDMNRVGRRERVPGEVEHAIATHPDVVKRR